jgi:hypothetical protein
MGYKRFFLAKLRHLEIWGVADKKWYNILNNGTGAAFCR